MWAEMRQPILGIVNIILLTSYFSRLTSYPLPLTTYDLSLTNLPARYRLPIPDNRFYRLRTKKLYNQRSQDFDTLGDLLL